MAGQQLRRDGRHVTGIRTNVIAGIGLVLLIADGSRHGHQQTSQDESAIIAHDWNRQSAGTSGVAEYAGRNLSSGQEEQVAD